MGDLRERLSAADCPPPWIRLWCSTVVRGITGDHVLASQRNIDLAVAAVNALPRLLREQERLREALRALVDSAALVPMAREDDDDGPAEFWCVHPDPLAAARAALGEEAEA